MPPGRDGSLARLTTAAQPVPSVTAAAVVNGGLFATLVVPAMMRFALVMVPVVNVPEVNVFETGVWKVASTSGIKRLMKSGKPRSTTALLR